MIRLLIYLTFPSLPPSLPSSLQFYVVMHRNDERVWLPELMQLKLSTLEKLVSIFANGQIYCFCTNKVRRAGGSKGGRPAVNIIL